ncbi:MAG TPA: hypothetical protein VFR94_18360 [Nitrososphaeraceae archaeon]|nr:hypothetical protein [Nitrososphaeraceae archaeon]
MIYGPIALFYSMADIIFYRSMFRWSIEEDMDKEDKNMETLPQMYSIVYKKILEIQFKLSEFVRSIKFGLDYKQVIVGGRDNKLVSFGLGALVDLYRKANMSSEIQQVINSLINLNEEIKGLKLMGLENLHSSLDEKIRELIRDNAAAENHMRELMELLQSKREEQLGFSNESVTKELEQKLLDQGTHFRMFEIMDVERVLRKSKPDEKLIDIELYMPGIEFPLNRNKMIDYAQREFLDRDAFLLNIFQSLDAETYETKENLEHALTSLFNTSRKDFFGKNQTFDRVTIYTNKEKISENKKSIDKKVTTEH